MSDALSIYLKPDDEPPPPIEHIDPRALFEGPFVTPFVLQPVNKRRRAIDRLNAQDRQHTRKAARHVGK